MTHIKDQDKNVYDDCLRRLRSAVTDGYEDEIVRANDSIIDIFVKLGEDPPDYTPF